MEVSFLKILIMSLFLLVKSDISLPEVSKDEPPFKFKLSPPGTVWLRDSVFIDVAPVSNMDYREFQAFVQICYNKELRDSMKNLPLYGIDMNSFQSYMRLCGPDKQMAQKMKIPLDAPLSWNMTMNEYYNSPNYNKYPVVFLSYIQAAAYCDWRTDMTMLLFSGSSKDEKHRAKYYKKVKYRLPTVDEWSYAMEKFKENTFKNFWVYAGEKTATIEAFPQKKNLQFVYIPHNVAEMSIIEKTALGISWRDEDTTENYAKTVSYSGPRDWLGFRCVCEILEY